MGDAVARIRSHLVEQARGDWEQLEDAAAASANWLRGELRGVALAAKLRPAALDALQPFARVAFVWEDEHRGKKRRLSRVSANETRKASADAGRREEVDVTSADEGVSSTHEHESGSEVEGIVETAKPDRRKSRKRARPQDSSDVIHMRVADLKVELKKRGLKTTGVKAELLDRLLDAMEGENARDGSDGVPAATPELQTVPEKASAVQEMIDLSDSPVKRKSNSVLPAPSAGLGVRDSLMTDDNGKHSATDSDKPVKDHRFSLVNETAHINTEMASTNQEKEVRTELVEPRRLSAHMSDVGVPRASLPGLGELENSPDKEAPHRETHSIDGSRPSAATDFAAAASEEVVPSSYASPRAAPEVTADANPSTEEDPSKQSTPEETTTTSILLSPAPLVKGSVAWLHSRAKNAFKALTENTIDTSTSNTSLLARGFRALQGAMVQEDVPVSTPTEQGSSTKSASVDKDDVVSPGGDSPLLLPLSERLHSRKVGFASSNAVGSIVNESRHDETNSEMTARLSTHENDASSNGRIRSVSLPKADLAADGSHKLAKTPEAAVPSSTADKAKSAEADKSDEAKRLREFQESVEREAQRLRLAAKQSAKKRLEESKAKAYWEQSEKLKLKLQAQASSSIASEAPIASKSGYVEESLVSLEPSRPELGATELTTSVPFTSKANDDAKLHKPALLASDRSLSRPRADSMSSTVSSVTSSTGPPSEPTTNSTAGEKRALSNLVSGVHSFATLVESNKVSSSASTTRAPPVVNALKLAEKTKQLEEKKRQEKIRRKEAMKKKYEEQRRQEEEKKRLASEAKERAEQEAKQKREQERLQEKKQREQELAQKRMKKLQEMRAGLAKKRAEEQQRKEAAKAATSAAPPNATKQLVPPAPPTKVRPARPPRRSSTKPAAKANPPVPPTTTQSTSTTSKASSAQVPAQAPAAAPAAAPAPAPPSKKPATTTAASYDISDKSESDNESVDDESDHKRRRRDAKDIPEWARRENLDKILRMQFGPNAIDPSPSIFPDFADTCDLEAIFDTSDARRKKRFGRRTSSGNWSGDRPTTRDQALYRQDMGFGR